VPRVLEAGTDSNYNRMIDLWDEYVSDPSMPKREYLLIITLLGGTDTRGEIREPTLTIYRR
jgi:hypothetical protein